VLDLFYLLFRVRGEPVTEVPALLGAGAEVSSR